MSPTAGMVIAALILIAGASGLAALALWGFAARAKSTKRSRNQ
jgi:hypothetical protein